VQKSHMHYNPHSHPQHCFRAALRRDAKSCTTKAWKDALAAICKGLAGSPDAYLYQYTGRLQLLLLPLLDVDMTTAAVTAPVTLITLLLPTAPPRSSLPLQVWRQ
jgi:hypothetical protein